VTLLVPQEQILGVNSRNVSAVPFGLIDREYRRVFHGGRLDAQRAQPSEELVRRRWLRSVGEATNRPGLWKTRCMFFAAIA